MEEKPGRLTQYFATATVSVGAVGVGSVLGFNSPASYQLRAPQNDTDSFEGSNRTLHHDPSLLQNDVRALGRHLMWFTQSNFTAENFWNATGISSIEQDMPLLTADQRAAEGRALTENEITMTKEELSWFMSVFALGALAGGLLSSPLMNKIGRRGTLVASAVPSLAGWLMTGLGTEYPLLLTGRVLTGVFVGIHGAAANAYIGEIASSDIRGILGSCYELFIVVGILLVMLVGTYTEWQLLALIATAPTLLFALLMLFNKESPAYLLMKGKEAEARAALQYFRGPDYSIEKEINDVKESQKEAKAAKFRPADLKKPHIYKPLIITFTICIFAQLVGIEVLTSNLSTIFESTGMNLSENTSSIICIVMEILAGVAAIFLVERAGRKTLLIFSAAVMTLCLGSLGAYFYLLQEREDWTVQHLSWLPLTALIVFVVAYGVGFGPVVWILVGEMFPPLVRETAAGVAVTVIWTTSFVTVQSYEVLMESLHSYGFYWLYTGFCAASLLFSIFVLKETRGKTLEEITLMFVKSNPILKVIE